MDSFVIAKWKSEMRDLLKARYKGKYSEAEIEEKLSKIVAKCLKNPAVTVFNNYTNTAVRTNILALTDQIEKNQLIIAGGGAIFMPHGAKPNILIDFITNIMGNRNAAKKQRKNYPKNSDMWLQWDIAQLLFKLVINSLYGCMGYPGFTLYNLFTAEAITSEGRHIITTAINALEGFLGGAMYFMDENELNHYLVNIHNEYVAHGVMDLTAFGDKDWIKLATNRVLSQCKWEVSEKQKDYIVDVLCHKDDGELAMLYYKNNLMEFSRLPFIMEKFRYIINQNGLLSFCEEKLLKDESIRQLVASIWDFYKVFVVYDYPVNDRIRKAMYLPKSRCLYTDTDSVFISLCHFVDFIEYEVCKGLKPDNYESIRDLRFTAVNLILIYVNKAIDLALHTLCYSTNIPPEWADRLSMKNEFYNERMLFVPNKKRYLSLAILQEGQVLTDDDGRPGLPEIKGFDFKKSTTKPYLRDYYTNLATNEILRSPQISPIKIFGEMCHLKADIETGIHSGETKYFKQSKVKSVDQYKNPYSIQGVTSVMLWNALVPQSQIELPGDVNIVPIKPLGMKKPGKNQVGFADPRKNQNVAEFAEKYPEAFDLLSRAIYENPNPSIAYMSLSSIALPKNENVEIPQYIYDLIDYSSIVDSAMQLFLPIMEAIGISSLPTTSTTSHMSNIIKL